MNTIDWQTGERALKAVFPLAAANPQAAYDAQVGVVMRGNNDPKKYEVPQQQWIDLTEQWLATLPTPVAFGSMCRVHRAQLQLLRGEWGEAERNALQVGSDLDANRIDYAAEAWYVVAEARRLRGDPSAADAYDESHARGRDPQPGRALLQLRDGDPAGAATSVRAVPNSRRSRSRRCAAPNATTSVRC